MSEADVSSSGLIKCNCSSHPDKIITFYCTCHDVIICDRCLADDHQNCQNVQPLDEAAKNVRASFAFEDVQSRLKGLSTVLSKISDVQTNHFSELDLEQQEKNIIKNIFQVKQAIIQKLDKEGKESISITVHNEFKSFKERCKVLINELIRDQRFVDESIQNLTELEKSASEQQLLQAVKEMDKRTHEIEALVQSRFSKTSHIEFRFYKEAEKITSFDSFGRIVTSEKEIELPMLRQVQAPKTTSDNRKFRLLYKFPTSNLKQDESVVRGCIVKDKLLLPSYKNSFLYVCNHDGTEVKCIPLMGAPFDVGIINTKHAIVTMRDKGYHIFDTEHQTLRHRKKPCCYNVSCNNGQIYTNDGCNKIVIFNENGDIQSSFETIKYPQYIHLSSTGKFYYTTFADEIYQLTSSGERVFFKHFAMEKPTCMTTDGSGNLYVVYGEYEQILKISENDHIDETVLEEDDGVRVASGMHFDIDSQRLLLLNAMGTEILVFQLD